MCSRRERQRERLDDYISGNKYGLSTAGMEMLSGVAVARGLEDAIGSAIHSTPVFKCVCVRVCVCVCVFVCVRVCTWLCVCMG